MLVSLAVQPRTNRVTWSYSFTLFFFVSFSPLQFHFLVSVAVHSTQFLFPVHLSIPSRSRSIAAYFFYHFKFVWLFGEHFSFNWNAWGRMVSDVFFFSLLRLYFLYQSAISLLIIQWHLSISANIIWFHRSVRCLPIKCDGRENVREIILIKTPAAFLIFFIFDADRRRQKAEKETKLTKIHGFIHFGIVGKGTRWELHSLDLMKWGNAKKNIIRRRLLQTNWCGGMAKQYPSRDSVWWPWYRAKESINTQMFRCGHYLCFCCCCCDEI